MIPETFDYISELTEQAHALGMEVLVEIHSYYRDQVEIARRVDRVYDFALPPLVLHTIFRKGRRRAEADGSPSARAMPLPCSIRTTASA